VIRIDVRTCRREELVDITPLVVDAVRASGIDEGLVSVYCPHTTAGVTINEHADPDVGRDIIDGLARLAPSAAGWRHAEGNSDAHVKAALVGAGAVVPVTGARPALGTWQGVFLCEVDGPRDRRVLVTVIGA